MIMKQSVHKMADFFKTSYVGMWTHFQQSTFYLSLFGKKLANTTYNTNFTTAHWNKKVPNLQESQI
jgi:hypothetical protein